MRSQVVVLVSFLSILLINCSKKESQEIQPTISDITESVYASGVIKAKDQYIVYPTVSGILKKKIVSIINSENDYDVYKINRSSICFGKKINYGGWSNQYAVRLWKKGMVIINNNLVHEEFITEKKIGKVQEHINHHTYLTLKDYLDRFNKYTSLGAKEYHKRGKKANFFGIVINPIFKFIRMYFFRLGFLDGVEGLLLAILSSNYTMVKYYKLLELNRRDKNGNK